MEFITRLWRTIQCKVSHSIVVAFVFAYLTACVSLTPTMPTEGVAEPTATRIPSTPTVIPPTTTPTYTPFPPTPESQPTPDVFYSDISKRFLFAGTEDCKLPCWHGLHIGEAHLDEVQSKLKEVLDLPPDYAFGVRTTPLGDATAYFMQGFWNISDPDSEFTNPDSSVVIYFDPTTQLVTALSFGWSNYIQYPTTPSRIMRLLGEPTDVLVDFQLAAHAPAAILSSRFYFAEEDFSMSIKSRIPVDLLKLGGREVLSAQWCLNGGPGYEERTFGAAIYPPLDAKLPVLQQLREFTLQSRQNALAEGTLVELARIFNVTPKQMYERVIQDENACLEYQWG